MSISQRVQRNENVLKLGVADFKYLVVVFELGVAVFIDDCLRVRRLRRTKGRRGLHGGPFLFAGPFLLARLLSNQEHHRFAVGLGDLDGLLGVLQAILGQVLVGIFDEFLGPDVRHSRQKSLQLIRIGRIVNRFLKLPIVASFNEREVSRGALFFLHHDRFGEQALGLIRAFLGNLGRE